MCQFIETVCLEDGCILRTSYHNARMNAVRKELFSTIKSIRIEDWIDLDICFQQRTRCRILYEKDIVKVEYFPYHLRKVQTLKLIKVKDNFDYHFKYANRSELDALFGLRGIADEILIVREGRITDTSIGNVALFDGESWFTPAFPLLKGTHRQFLLDSGQIFERDICAEKLCDYMSIRIFNAMIHWGEIELPLSSIIGNGIYL